MRSGLLILIAASSAAQIDPFEQGMEHVRLAERALAEEAEAPPAAPAPEAPPPPSLVRAEISAETVLVEQGAPPSGGKRAHRFGLPFASARAGGPLGAFGAWRLELSGANGEPDLREAWLEAQLVGDHLRVRLGPTLRRFGPHNEALVDRVETVGMTPHELWDPSRPLLTPTTHLMVHGRVEAGAHEAAWAVLTGADDRAAGQLPVGLDAQYGLGGWLRLGASFHYSGGKAVPGEGGSPVPDWMVDETYWGAGGFVDLRVGALRLDAAFYRVAHRGTRSPARVEALAWTLSDTQLRRFFADPQNPVADEVVVDVTYPAQDVWLGAAYALETGAGPITVHARLEHFLNEEMVARRSVGGDAETGYSDTGNVLAPLVGASWRPVPQAAIKLEGRLLLLRHEGEDEVRHEIGLGAAWRWDSEEGAR